MSVNEEIKTLVDEEPVEEFTEDIPSQPMFGLVSDCFKLNVRIEPNKDSDIMCVIGENEEVMIDPDYSTEDWYKVYTKEGVDGFCMKEFIEVQ